MIINTILTSSVNVERPFIWGKYDCCLWVADMLLAIHGIDFAEKYRGKYSNEKEFKKLLIKNKVKTLEELVLNEFGIPVPGYLARKGWPMLLEEYNEFILGMCYGTYALFLTQDGFTKRDLSSCKYSWKI